MDNIKDILREAKKALDEVENGATYTASYVVQRFNKAAQAHPHDQLIGNMRDVLAKRASNSLFISQSDISNLYTDMYGLSGGHTAFRDELGDLLPESMQFKRVAHSTSKLRTNEEINPEPIHKDSELSNAFSVLFSLGNQNSFATYKVAKPQNVEEVVLTKLSKLGHTPVQVKVGSQNEHFALCTALYKNRRHEQLALHIPVPVVDGQPMTPTLMIQGENTVDLTKDNLYVHLRESSNYKKASTKAKVGGDLEGLITVDKAVLPASLEKFADFETKLVEAASNFSPTQINYGTNLVATELGSYFKTKPQVKVASSNKSTVTFKAEIPTAKGLSSIFIPVEYHNGKPILPSKFAAETSAGNENIYGFDRGGFEAFLTSIQSDSRPVSIARQTGELSKMSYHQLMDRVIEGAATKDYKMSEDALLTVRERFGPELHVKAMTSYAELLRNSSTQSSRRKEFIKSARDRGELISVPTTVELYNPKLGLPLSKIEFDDSGRMYPKGRGPKYANKLDEPEVISTSKIFLN